MTRETFYSGLQVIAGIIIFGASAACRAQSPLPVSSAFPAPFVASDAPQILVTLSRSVYCIQADPKTGAPKMPNDVTATATAVNWPAGEPKPTVFIWHVFLDWKLPGWDGFETRHPIDEKLFTAPSPFKPDWGGVPRGGALTIYAKTTLRGQEVCGMARASVIGVNPSRRAVLAAFPVSRFGLMASKVGTAESGLRQFTAANATDPGGMPVTSSSGDIGMMQLNAPTGAITSSDQVWDWRENVKRGMEMLAGKHRTSVTVARHVIGRGWQRPAECGLQCLANLNAVRLALEMTPVSAPEAPPLSDVKGSGILPGEEDPDHLCLNQLERDAIRRYNGGREYAFTILPNPDTLGIASANWEVDPTRGGIRATSGAINYVQRVLTARSGLVYPPPPKPKPKAKLKPKSKTMRHSHRARKKAK